jgi:tRNA1(Val) A37 N6-methylase TrmN6
MWTAELERRVMNSPLRRFFHRLYEFPVYEGLLARAGVRIGPTSRVLDAGCGAGFASLLVQERSHPAEHYAFDLQPEQVCRARRQLPSSSLQATSAMWPSLRMPLTPC